jgi:hypothetical protein
MAWIEERANLSPAQEREFWIAKVGEYPHGMAVNCSHMPSLDKTPILLKLIEDGVIIRVREGRRHSNSSQRRTLIYLRKHYEEKKNNE